MGCRAVTMFVERDVGSLSLHSRRSPCQVSAMFLQYITQHCRAKYSFPGQQLEFMYKNRYTKFRTNLWKEHPVELCNYTITNKVSQTQHLIVRKIALRGVATYFYILKYQNFNISSLIIKKFEEVF
jgi:hypothetical protein